MVSQATFFLTSGAPTVRPEADTSNHLTRTYTQHLAGTTDEVFPLLGPIGEKRWAQGSWNPTFVHPPRGADEVGCVFTTRAQDGHETVWVLTRFTRSHEVEYVQVTPGLRVTQLQIALAPDGPGHSAAAITYIWTALSPEGQAWLDAHRGEQFDESMAEWEQAVNAYLHRAVRR
jgi:hypothetical protein